MKQTEFVHGYIEKNIEKFNEKLFTRSDEEVIEALKKIILSCQRESFFTIKVKGFRVVEGYREVNETLRKYQDYLQSKGSSRSKNDEDNRYNFIDLKESALKLLIVTYYVAIKDEHDTIDVIIAVPRVVDKFYYLINGSYYSAMYQIVDASTYNNATSKKDSHCVTLKTTFQPIRIFRNVLSGDRALRTTKGEIINSTQYDCMAFNKSVSTSLYIFAKYGYYDALTFLGLGNAIILTSEDMDNDDFYTFQPQTKDGMRKGTCIFINVPKMLFDGNFVLQHVVNMICNNIEKGTELNDIFCRDYWINRLGMSYSSAPSTDTLAKGNSVLISIKGVYDIATKEDIHLPEEYKYNVFRIIQWMINEYNNLKLKDNLNIMTKKIRCADYIASMYAAKLSKGIYRLSDQGKRADLSSIRKIIVTNPMFLVSQMSKCQLINFRNIVTDMDSLLALKCTYKGVSGIGESGSNSIPEIYRHLDVSNMGVLDPDASSPTDPGISGSIVPLLKTYGNGYFSDFEEPLTWDSEYMKLCKSYREAKGLTEILEFRKKILDDRTVSDEDIIMKKEAEEVILGMVSNLETPVENEEFIGLPLEGSGRLYYE